MAWATPPVRVRGGSDRRERSLCSQPCGWRKVLGVPFARRGWMERKRFPGGLQPAPPPPRPTPGLLISPQWL